LATHPVRRVKLSHGAVSIQNIWERTHTHLEKGLTLEFRLATHQIDLSGRSAIQCDAGFYGYRLPKSIAITARYPSDALFWLTKKEALVIELDLFATSFNISGCNPRQIFAAFITIEDYLLWKLIEDICERLSGENETSYLEAATQFLVYRLFLIAQKPRLTQKNEESLNVPAGPIRRACEFMLSRLDEQLTMIEVAAVADLSVGHFTSRFKQALLTTPDAWLRRKRIEHSQRLLRERGGDISQIAFEVGYANQSSFGVAFKRETGLSPTEWSRRQEASTSSPRKKKPF
jgi:AraC-like DNA-binding protein